MTDEPTARPEGREKTFTEMADFGGTIFTEMANFRGAIFTERANFSGTTFAESAIFEGTTFTEGAIFEGATFAKGAHFGNAKFTEGANFAGTTFSEPADFAGATFTIGASFERATFREWAYFGGTTFKGAYFDRATFTEDANFDRATFTDEANFSGATFKSTVSFVNSKMKSRTSFDRTAFQDSPPLFYGAKLHEGTSWFDATWPDPRKDNAEAAVGAYERLKLEMDKLKKHEDELDFFALELQTRRVLAGKWTTLHGMAISLYGWLCNYGRSYVRPLWLLGAVAVLGAMPFVFYFGLPGWRGSLALSFANTFGILGLRREFFLPTVISDLPQILKLLALMQTVAGGVLFFLFGLALRNRFRMR